MTSAEGEIRVGDERTVGQKLAEEHYGPDTKAWTGGRRKQELANLIDKELSASGDTRELLELSEANNRSLINQLRDAELIRIDLEEKLQALSASGENIKEKE